MQVTEGNRRCALVADEALEHGIVRIRPEVLVVVRWIRVHDQQLIVVFTDAQGKRQFPQPREPMLADLPPGPRNLRPLGRRQRCGNRLIEHITVLVTADACCADLFQTQQYLLWFWSVQAEVARNGDAVGTPLRFEVCQTGVEC